MKLLRSWPASVPPGRFYVVDGIPKLIMSNYDYAVLADVEDDVLLIEWDIAVGMEELTWFVNRAASAPDEPLAAPYRLYHGPTGNPLSAPVWTAFRYENNDQIKGALRQVVPGVPTAHVASFGCTYLPRDLILRYLEARDRANDGESWRFSDISFFSWHFRCVGQDVALDWEVRPVHLHYELPDDIRRVTSVQEKVKVA